MGSPALTPPTTLAAPTTPRRSRLRGNLPFRGHELSPLPHSPIVVPATAGTQGRGEAQGRLPLSSFPHTPTALPAKAGIQGRSACPFVLSLSKGVNGGAIAPCEGES